MDRGINLISAKKKIVQRQSKMDFKAEDQYYTMPFSVFNKKIRFSPIYS